MVGGEPAPVFGELELHERRKVAVAWLEWSCGVPEARAVSERDQRYRVVTADLDPGSFGVTPDPVSSCAFLPHWLYVQIGVREPWVDHPMAPGGWRGDGGILSRLVRQSVPWDHRKLEGGDVIIVAHKWPSGKDAHVVCVCDEARLEDDEHWLATAEYGQPGGALHSRSWNRSHWGGSRKPVRVVLPLERVLRQAFGHGLLEASALPHPPHVPSQGA